MAEYFSLQESEWRPLPEHAHMCPHGLKRTPAVLSEQTTHSSICLRKKERSREQKKEEDKRQIVFVKEISQVVEEECSSGMVWCLLWFLTGRFLCTRNTF